MNAPFWTEEEDQILRKMVKEGACTKQITKALNRPASGIRQRAKRLCLVITKQIVGSKLQEPRPMKPKKKGKKDNRPSRRRKTLIPYAGYERGRSY